MHNILTTILILTACGVTQAVGFAGGFVGSNDGGIRLGVAAGAPYGSGWVGGLAGRSGDGTSLDDGPDERGQQREELRCKE